MAIYGSYLAEAKMEKEYELTKEDMNILYQAYIETCISIAEDVDEEEYLSEGANLDMIKTLRKSRQDFGKACSACKKALNNKEFKNAKAQIKIMKSVLESGKKEVNKLGEKDGTMETSVIGFFAGLIPFFARNMLWIVTSAGIAKIGRKIGDKGISNYDDEQTRYYDFLDAHGRDLSDDTLDRIDKNHDAKLNKAIALNGFGRIMQAHAILQSFIKALVSIIKTVMQVKKDLDNKDVSTNSALNFNRNQIMQCYNDLEKQLTKLEQAITKAESESK